jgi:putative effector of murein hydrolase LrgA (UPF0299 family)
METLEQVSTIAQASNADNLMEFLIRILINFISIFIIVRAIYYPIHKNKDFLFTFFLFNIINFLICFLLSAAKLKIGFAFGLFAIFSILRYRTVTIPVREMGYFFISVTIGIINSLASSENYFLPILMANTIIIILTYVLDGRIKLKHENFKQIVYERIDLIVPERREEMIIDLKNRTGMNIHRVEFIKIDFLKDIAFINAFYYSDKNEAASLGLNEDSDD